MKVRILSGIIAALFAIGMLVILQTIVPVLILMPICALATFEILRTAKITNKGIQGLSMAVSLVMPLILEYDLIDKSPLPLAAWLVLFCLCLLVLMLAQYEKTKFEHVAIALYAALFIPFAISGLVLVRKMHIFYPAYFQQSHSLFFVLTALTSCWMTDTGAFFFGSKFGKHKLAPKISPKKSVEGALGGIFMNVLVNVIIFLICSRFYFVIDSVKIWMVILFSAVFSVVSMLGDLSASVIKRNYGAKDFGKIMPGHGGAMDRFDSYSFVMPLMWIVLTAAMKQA